MLQMPTAEELAALQKALVEATRRSESLVGELRVVTTERDLALERLLALQGQLFAVKSEARGSEQKDLFLNEAEALAPTAQTLPAEIADEESTTASGHQRKKHGRKPLDPALPRDIVRHELPESECVCAHDGHALVEIGAEVSEQMHVIPEQVRVLQHHRIKYACPCCDLSLKAAPTPARIVSAWGTTFPFLPQAQIFSRTASALSACKAAQLCGRSSSIRLFGCVGRRVSTSFR